MCDRCQHVGSGELGLHDRSKIDIQEAHGIYTKRTLHDGINSLCGAISNRDVVLRLPIHDGFTKLLLIKRPRSTSALSNGPPHQSQNNPPYYFF